MQNPFDARVNSPSAQGPYVIGIDAGGTKTVCLLADEHGRVIAEGRGAGANLQTAGELAVEKVLHGVMEAAIGDRPIVPAAICLGIAESIATTKCRRSKRSCAASATSPGPWSSTTL
jgi:N-acetylglucosamine kinase-like BadF-type ATPase